MKERTKIQLRASALLPLLALLPTLGAQTASQPAAPADNGQTIQLPAFSVTADRTDPYRPTQVLSVARVAGDINDQPMTVNVVTSDLLNDLGANASYDVTRYFAGVSNGRGAGAIGIADRQDFRGFESFSKTIDNFSSFLFPGTAGFQANFDPAFIDRAELVMGPDTILAPTGTPGGSENILTKAPLFNRQTTVSGEIGNFNAGKVVVDTTGAVGDSKNLAYRVIADYQDAEEFQPGSLRAENILAGLTYKFSDTAKLDVKYIGLQWEVTGADATSNQDGEIIYSPTAVKGATISETPENGFAYNGWDGDATWSHRFSRVQILEGDFTSALTDHVSMRLGAEVLNENRTLDAAFPLALSSSTEIFDPSTGNVTGLATPAMTKAGGYMTVDSTGKIASIGEVAQYNHVVSRQIQLQNDYAGNFQVGPINVKPVAGWTYQQGHSPVSVTSQTPNPNGALPVAGALPIATDLFNGYSAPHPAYSTYTASNKDVPGMGVQEQAYAMSGFGALNDRILASVGVSRSWVYINNYTATNFTGISPAGATYTNAPLNSQQDTYIAGILGKVTKNVSLYYDYSTNAAPTSFNNVPIWNTGTQNEFGVKTSWFNDRLSVNADHFDISEDNLSSTNPGALTGGPANILVDAKNSGYELNVIGGITQNLSIIGSITTMKYRDPWGRRPRNVPDDLSSLLLNYHLRSGFLANLNFFGGVVHEGNTAGETETGFTPAGMPDQVGFYLPSWTVFNAGAGYTLNTFGMPVHLNLNVDNVFNKQFWWEAAGRNSVSPYPGTTVRLTTSITF